MHTLRMKGTDNHAHGLIIVDHERSMLPVQNDEYRTVAGRDGMLHFSRELGNREVRVKFLKYNESEEDWMNARREIVKWLHSKEEIDFSFDDEVAIFYKGKVSTIDIPQRFKPDVKFWVTFTAHPFKYRLVMDETLMFDMGVATVTNGGNYETPYIFSGTLGASSDRFNMSVNGVSIGYWGPLVSGDTITIDTDKMEFRVNGDLKVLEVSGYFTTFESGDNAIVVDVPGEYRVLYRERDL